MFLILFKIQYEDILADLFSVAENNIDPWRRHLRHELQ